MSEGKKTGKKVVFIGCLSLVLLGGLVMVPVIILLSIAGGGAPVGCLQGGGTLSATYNGPGVAGLSQLQMSRAAAIVAEGRQMGIPDRGIVVALATASQESHFQVYANDGQGGDLKADQAGIAASLNIPHDAVGTDHGSLGVFQQQWPWWGTMQELMDPAMSAQKFYNALLKVPNWQNMPVTVAAQTVQSSAYPSAYADDQPLAEQLLATIGNNTGSTTTQVNNGDTSSTDTNATNALGSGGNKYTLENGVYVGGTPTCATPVGAAITGGGTVAFPVPQNSGYVDQHNYGGNGSHWAHYHTGDDLSVACGTPVLAATNGTVIIKTGSGWSWSGNWLVQIQTAGPGSLTTWYGHMRKLDVTNGQQVTAGQQIGEVGDLGNATGCHLHFEVHPKGGGYMEDDIDPDPWLAANVGKTLPGTISPVGATTGGQGTFGIGTLNWRGASHYKKNPHPGEQPYSARVPNMVAKVNSSGASIIGFQEFEPPQARAFLRATGGQWALARGRVGGHDDARDAIAYQPSAWSVSETRYVEVNYGGSHQQMPLVRFTSKTGLGDVWVLNTHNPANVIGGTTSMRDQAVRAEAATLKSLAATGVPVLFTGDMNDKGRFKQLFLSQAGAGFSTANPTNKQIDWIMGGPGVSFSGTVVDQSTNDRAHRYTDHPFVHTTAALGGGASSAPAGGAVNATVTMVQANLPSKRGYTGQGPAGIRRIVTADPDFITLNEQTHRSVRSLTSAVSGYDGWRDPSADPQDAGGSAMENIVMWNSTKWTKVDAGRERLITKKMENGVVRSRYATWVILRSRTDANAQIVVVATHMPVNPEGVGGQGGVIGNRGTSYSEGMDNLVALINKLAAYGPVLTGGDFNNHPYQTQSWAAVPHMTAAGYSYTASPKSGIDYVFYPTKVQVVSHSDMATGPTSDHPFYNVTTLNMNGVGPSGAATSTAPAGLTMLSYNINHHGANEALAQELANSGAQVIALQDTDAATVQWLAQRLGMQAAYAPLGTWQGKTLVDNALLSRYPMYDTDNSTLPVPSGAQPRGMLHAALGISRGVFVDVYVTHLGGDQAATLAQAERAAENVDDSNCGAVLMGDMNATPGTPPIAALTKDLVDTFADGKYGPAKTTPAKKPTQRVDYMLHDKSTKVTSAQVMPAGASTHLGVRATFSTSGDCE